MKMLQCHHGVICLQTHHVCCIYSSAGKWTQNPPVAKTTKVQIHVDAVCSEEQAFNYFTVFRVVFLRVCRGGCVVVLAGWLNG